MKKNLLVAALVIAALLATHAIGLAMMPCEGMDYGLSGETWGHAVGSGYDAKVCVAPNYSP